VSCVLVVNADMSVFLDESNERQESDIITNFKALFASLGRMGKSIAEGVRLIFLGRRSSIVALFICENRTGLTNLVKLYALGKLHPILEELFSSLLATAEVPQTTVHIKKLVWELSDYCRCSLFFNPLPKREF